LALSQDEAYDRRMTTLLGCKLITDWEPLEKLLELIKVDPQAETMFETKFPGMLGAVFRSICHVQERRLKADTILYRNFRVQAWPQAGFDADPSPAIRVVPAGVPTEAV
jgi:hypothetical protein